ncbi:MAG: phosphatidate cytidylyltransferase [Fimbriimonadaceae bacterium]
MRQRVFTAVVGAPVVLAALFAPMAWPLALLMLAAVVAGSIEIAEMVDKSRRETPLAGVLVVLLVGCQALGLLPRLHGSLEPFLLFGLWLVGVAATRALIAGRRPAWLRELSALWVGAPMAALLWVAFAQPVAGDDWRLGNPLIMPLFAIWAGDSAAILAGRWFGKRPLAPRISPKKTVEGSLANLVVCVLVALLVAWSLDAPLAIGFAVGAICGVLGQVGDLFESALKRTWGKKDSGVILPGHGGLLDRVDSILFAAPASVLVMLPWVQP